MSKKRHRRRKQIPNTLRCYYGRAEYSDTDELVYNYGAGCPKSDAYLLHTIFNTGESTSFINELIARGYDVTTLEFSIKKL
jgi:hypothetical protein